jgi:hypothetical protein
VSHLTAPDTDFIATARRIKHGLLVGINDQSSFPVVGAALINDHLCTLSENV